MIKSPVAEVIERPAVALNGKAPKLKAGDGTKYSELPAAELRVLNFLFRTWSLPPCMVRAEQIRRIAGRR